MVTKTLLAALVLCHLAAVAQAQAYGHYDIQSVATVNQSVPDKPMVTINMKLYSQVLDDLGAHAGSYPPRFDSPEDRQRAERDVTSLSGVLDAVADSIRDESVLLRLALLHQVGFNLDLPGSDDKTVAVFDKVLAMWPNDPQVNFRYGVFMAGTVKYRRQAIPLLEKAKSLGVKDADYPLGMTYMSLGEKPKAVENLTSYTARVPSDQNAARILDAVIHDQVNFKRVSAPP